ncbi:MAG: hypothetical protein ACE5G9_10765 [Nitrospinales bacterium]
MPRNSLIFYLTGHRENGLWRKGLMDLSPDVSTISFLVFGKKFSPKNGEIRNGDEAGSPNCYGISASAALVALDRLRSA